MFAANGSRVHALTGFTVSWCELSKTVGTPSVKWAFFAQILLPNRCVGMPCFSRKLAMMSPVVFSSRLNEGVAINYNFELQKS
jgi:hypothetical protein